MTTKTLPRPSETRETAPDALTAAYQVHTLVQMVYARLSVPPAWTPTVPAPYPPVVH